MADFSSINGLCCPLIALLTSTGADSVSEKNSLSFADMLAPFCKAQINIKVDLFYILKFIFCGNIFRIQLEIM